MKPARFILILFSGALFGIGLAISGMTDPARVIGFLDIFGKWDPALVFVMAGAVAVYAIGTWLLGRVAIEGCKIPSAESARIDRKLLIGAAIFGLGWGLGGFCPGPALANLGALRSQAIVFVPAMAIGMFMVQRFCGSDN